ncbi:MAG: amylo-alpha-1,6-glucosidase [Acidimicrobiia bacterium]|nr:amylo-alpha-1,6-glucosidase [Acidimicrobiia bacterium]
MDEPWTFSGEAASWSSLGGVLSLVQGHSFCISGRTGDIRPDAAQGLFFRDVRHVHRYRLELSGGILDPLSVHRDNPFTGTIVQRWRPVGETGASRLLVVRRRYVGRGMREDIELTSYAPTPTELRLRLTVGADFADVFAVKEGRVPAGSTHPTTARLVARGVELLGDEVGTRLALVSPELDADATIELDGPGGAEVSLHWVVTIGPRGRWRGCLEAAPVLNGIVLPVAHPCGEPTEDAVPVLRLAEWHRRSPVVRSDHPGLQRLVTHGLDDLGALRFFDPAHPHRPLIAAGAPWFMNLFGRDSLLASWMALPLQPDLAAGVLRTLADLQGRHVRPDREEEPGRIIHEVRADGPPGAADRLYYGSADATPLFVMLLGEISRWGAPDDVVEPLLPHADRALEWMQRWGDRDGDGFIEYERATPTGLSNQGWKDSRDGVNHLDGSPADAPIALCEVQGYAYAAYLARASLADRFGDADGSARWRHHAEALRREFDRRFWLDERGWLAIALDGAKRPVEALSSNIGHCLWTGIVQPHRARRLAELMAGSGLFSGWGVRTLADGMGAYNPLSYHNGAVWPHDSAIAAAGLMRYGFVEEAQQLITGLLSAARHFDDRLPELFAGVGRRSVPEPVPYPTACSPQAWSAAAPLLILRTLLRLDPDVPSGRVWLAPALPAGFGRLSVEGMRLGGGSLNLDARGSEAGVGRLPAGLSLEMAPRPLP